VRNTGLTIISDGQVYTEPVVEFWANQSLLTGTAPSGGVVLPTNSYGYVAIETKTGLTRCMVEADYVGCETSATNWPSHGVKVAANGGIEWIDGNLGDINPIRLDYKSYRALGWKIVASGSGTRFTNERTGHGAFVSVDNVQGF
jgi:hypothetical protein